MRATQAHARDTLVYACYPGTRRSLVLLMYVCATQVQARDTLSSVAASFDIPVSELKKLNRFMGSGLIFAGQVCVGKGPLHIQSVVG